jgi:hypothetical protein
MQWFERVSRGGMMVGIMACKAQHPTDTDGGSDSDSEGTKTAVINEFMASNRAAFADPEDGSFPDWVELASNDGVELGGAHLTDDLAIHDAFTFPPGTRIAPGGYLIVFCDGDAAIQGGLHTSFRLSAAGEDIGLFDADGSLIDKVEAYGQQFSDISMARMPDITGDFEADTDSTPGEPNQ